MNVTKATSLRPIESQALEQLAAKNNTSVSQYLRGIIIDALVEEGYDLRPNQHPSRAPSREGRESQGSNPT